MNEKILKAIYYQLKKVNKNLEEQKEVKTLDYKDVADIMHINRNESAKVLRKYGYKCGHLAIEQSKLKEILHNATGDLRK